MDFKNLMIISNIYMSYRKVHKGTLQRDGGGRIETTASAIKMIKISSFISLTVEMVGAHLQKMKR